jgi:hypothetical protein
VAEGLRSQNKSVKIGLADPDGAALFNFYTTGEMKSSGGSITEGIGQGRITANLEGFTPDMSFNIPDSEAIPLVFDLLEHEGLCLGGSSGINVAGAIRMAREMGPGHTIVTILCDYGNRYQSKLFNPEFLASKDLPVPEWLTRKSDLSIPYASEPSLMKALFVLKTPISQPLRHRSLLFARTVASLLDQTCFYATSGGQPGDTGFLERTNGEKIDHRRHGDRRHQIRDHPYPRTRSAGARSWAKSW